MRTWTWALAGLLYATGAQAAVTITWQPNTEADLNSAIQYAVTCAGPGGHRHHRPANNFHRHDTQRRCPIASQPSIPPGTKAPFRHVPIVSLPLAVVTTVTPSSTGAAVRWTGTATRPRYASDDTRAALKSPAFCRPKACTSTCAPGTARSRGLLSSRGRGDRPMDRTGLQQFQQRDLGAEPDRTAGSCAADDSRSCTVAVHHRRARRGRHLVYSAADCPRGISRNTTGNKVRIMTLTCKNEAVRMLKYVVFATLLLSTLFSVPPSSMATEIAWRDCFI